MLDRCLPASLAQWSLFSLCFGSFVLGACVVLSAGDARRAPVLTVLFVMPLAFIRLLSSRTFWRAMLPPDQHAVAARPLTVDPDGIIIAYAIGFGPGAAVAFSVEAVVGSVVTLMYFLDQYLLDGGRSDASGADSSSSSSSWWVLPESVGKSIGYVAFLFVSSFVTSGLVEEAVRWSITLRMCSARQEAHHHQGIGDAAPTTAAATATASFTKGGGGDHRVAPAAHGDHAPLSLTQWVQRDHQSAASFGIAGAGSSSLRASGGGPQPQEELRTTADYYEQSEHGDVDGGDNDDGNDDDDHDDNDDGGDDHDDHEGDKVVDEANMGESGSNDNGDRLHDAVTAALGGSVAPGDVADDDNHGNEDDDGDDSSRLDPSHATGEDHHVNKDGRAVAALAMGLGAPASGPLIPLRLLPPTRPRTLTPCRPLVRGSANSQAQRRARLLDGADGGGGGGGGGGLAGRGGGGDGGSGRSGGGGSVGRLQDRFNGADPLQQALRHVIALVPFVAACVAWCFACVYAA
jgi:hypothetical protein